MISFKTAPTSGAVKETPHNVWSCWVSMTEAEEDLVAHLWDKHKSTVAPYVTAATAIRCHHTHPASLHAIRLLIHAYTHTTLTVRGSIAKHSCHLCLG